MAMELSILSVLPKPGCVTLVTVFQRELAVIVTMTARMELMSWTVHLPCSHQVSVPFIQNYLKNLSQLKCFILSLKLSVPKFLFELKSPPPVNIFFALILSPIIVAQTNQTKINISRPSTTIFLDSDTTYSSILNFHSSFNDH